jgi:hypothetical protein
MASDHARRVAALLAMQGNDYRERALRDNVIEVYELWETKATGGTYLAVFEDGSEAFHKPHESLKTSSVSDFGHNQDTPPMHECAAWHFAKALGEEYESLLPATVYRQIEGEWGSLAAKLPGVKPGTPAFTHAPDQVNVAGLFDVMIGQQDRHLNNFLWDKASGRLGLFDHGFCFPGDGHEHRIRSASLQRQRRYKKLKLDRDEVQLVERILASGDLLGIEPLLEPERSARMTLRLEKLIDSKVPVIPGREAT